MNTRTPSPTQNLKTSTVMLRELLNQTEQSRIAQQLSSKLGVRTANFSSNEPRCLKVEYDADCVSVLGILSFFENCALHARVQMLQGPN